MKIMKLLVLFLISGCILYCNKTDVKITNDNNKSFHLSKNTVSYPNIKNQNQMLYVPVVINLEHDRDIIVGKPVNTRITVSALQDISDVTIKVTLHPMLKQLYGTVEKKVHSFTAGETTGIELIVEPLRNDKYFIAVHVSCDYNGEKMGTSRSFQFSTPDYIESENKMLQDGVGNKKGNNFILRGRTETEQED